MSGLEELRRALADYLNGHGVAAVAAWESGRRTRRTGAVAAVSLRGCAGGPAGFQDYLGEQLDEKTGTWRELYGRRAELTFGLDIWGPREGGEGACAALFSRMAQALALGGPEGLRLREVSCGETAFDEGEGLFHCPAQAVGTVFLQAAADESGVFTNFTVKGTRR